MFLSTGRPLPRGGLLILGEMPHRIKARRNKIPHVYVPSRANQTEVFDRRCASIIHNQVQLEALLLQMKPEVRAAAKARLIPYLKFQVADSILEPLENGTQVL